MKTKSPCLDKAMASMKRDGLLPRPRKRKEAPDWFGCGKTITQESWDAFIAARKAYYERQDALP